MMLADRFLLRRYADCLFASPPRLLLGSVVRSLLLGERNREVISAIEYHGACKPAREGRQLVGYIDYVTPVERHGKIAVQLSGWLFHRKKRLVSLVMFDEGGTPAVADIGLLRPDLASCFPHERFAAKAGFRFVASIVNPQGQIFTFRTILTDDSVEYGSFEPCALST